MWTHYLQHSTHAEKLQKQQASAERKATTGYPISWRRPHEAKRIGFCAVDLRPQQHPYYKAPTGDTQFCMGLNTDGNTISYVSRKRQLRGYDGSATAHERDHMEAHYVDPRSHKCRLWLLRLFCCTLAWRSMVEKRASTVYRQGMQSPLGLR